ncbi:MAG TPA: DUF72 domain-containing protein [Parafilimonas sp.]|nr:DUF72 domain-containing protein [Parafilimonas sp.]
MQYFIGCSGFYNKDWKEVFFPKGLPQSKWFEFYCTQFNTLELNTTFYRFPRIEILQKWYDKSPADFKFSVKAPRLITHYKQFNDVARLLHDFYTSVQEGLREKLGCVLFQLPARIAYSEAFLQRITQNLDNSFKNVIEFRHISWWNQFVFVELAKHNISFCSISIKNLPAEIIANTSLLYYRFHGIKKLYFSEYTKQTIKNFGDELKRQININTAYIYFNNTATIAAINNGRYLKSILENNQPLPY